MTNFDYSNVGKPTSAGKQQEQVQPTDVVFFWKFGNGMAVSSATAAAKVTKAGGGSAQRRRTRRSQRPPTWSDRGILIQEFPCA